MWICILCMNAHKIITLSLQTMTLNRHTYPSVPVNTGNLNILSSLASATLIVIVLVQIVLNMSTLMRSLQIFKSLFSIY